MEEHIKGINGNVKKYNKKNKLLKNNSLFLISLIYYLICLIKLFNLKTKHLGDI